MTPFERQCLPRPLAWGLAAMLTLASPISAGAEDSRLHAEAVDFNRDVRPILATHCMECHGPDAESREAGLRFDTPDNVYADRQGYRVIDREQPEKSALLARILSDDPDVRMPPPDAPETLSQQETDMLKKWI